MALVVKSTLSNFDRRAAIRKTWGSVKILDDVMFQVVFVVGKTDDIKTMKKIDDEHEKHGDLLQYNYKDKAE